MDFISVFFFLVQVSSAFRLSTVIGWHGRSVTIQCPTKDQDMRKYWCKQSNEGDCITIISTSPFTHDRYKDRVSLTNLPKKGMFQIEMRSLEELDAGLYVCGIGKINNRASTWTLKVDLKVFDERALFGPNLLPADSPRRDTPHVISLIQMLPRRRPSQAPATQATKPAQITAQRKATSISPVASSPSSTTGTMSTPTRVISSPTAYDTTGSMTQGVMQGPRTNNSARRLYPKSPVTRKRKDKFHILISVILVIPVLMASLIMVRKLLRWKKAVSNGTHETSQRLSALERLQGQGPAENIYSVCPRLPRQSGPQVPGELNQHTVDSGELYTQLWTCETLPSHQPNRRISHQTNTYHLEVMS
ncbi:PREDICTED: fas apoptotic inhibitory molecule 3-like isoform X2 [Gavialis gangeticus]|uniref:fas apoptotic inhibitory molecule 3-like isoform X2 n=1 Tax=Gavialis gangeticus TaxID=94835 RepID=UPI00092F5C6E|nr:PREDICTED: fas apoptotic inhibitory molecule 3-like isoform X2 [Gavialis gangeticus]